MFGFPGVFLRLFLAKWSAVSAQTKIISEMNQRIEKTRIFTVLKKSSFTRARQNLLIAKKQGQELFDFCQYCEDFKKRI